MKKLICLLMVSLILGLSASVFAEKTITVKVNGEAVTFPDGQPFIDENGRTLVPVRFVSEKMKMKVRWDYQARLVQISNTDGDMVVLTIGESEFSKMIKYNYSIVNMDTVPIIKSDRTYVPLRFISEAFGAKVDWLEESQTVEITYSIPVVDTSDRIYFDLVSESGTKPVDFITPKFYAKLNENFTRSPGHYFEVHLENAQNFWDTAKQYNIKIEYLNYKELNTITDIFSKKQYQTDNISCLDDYMLKDEDELLRVLATSEAIANNIKMYDGIPISMRITFMVENYVQVFESTINVPEMK